jgi:hypothetical protein
MIPPTKLRTITFATLCIVAPMAGFLFVNIHALSNSLISFVLTDPRVWAVAASDYSFQSNLTVYGLLLCGLLGLSFFCASRFQSLRKRLTVFLVPCVCSLAIIFCWMLILRRQFLARIQSTLLAGQNSQIPPLEGERISINIDEITIDDSFLLAIGFVAIFLVVFLKRKSGCYKNVK